MIEPENVRTVRATTGHDIITALCPQIQMNLLAVSAAAQRTVVHPGRRRHRPAAGGRDRAAEVGARPAEGETGPHVPTGSRVRRNAVRRPQEPGRKVTLCACRPLQVGEIEEQLTTARRELARSEEANQKLQRDVKEVRRLPGFLTAACGGWYPLQYRGTSLASEPVSPPPCLLPVPPAGSQPHPPPRSELVSPSSFSNLSSAPVNSSLSFFC